MQENSNLQEYLMKNINVRIAGKEDAEDLFILNKEFNGEGTASVEFGLTRGDVPIDDYVERAIKNREAVLMLVGK